MKLKLFTALIIIVILVGAGVALWFWLGDTLASSTIPSRATTVTSPPPREPGYPQRPPGLPTGRVLRVVDGDTVDVLVNGREERVRLIGIDTPEAVDPRRPVECFGREASANARALLDGQTIYLEEDPSQDSRDRFGRLLRYLWLEDGRMVNLEQIRGGFAFEYTFRTPYIYRDIFQAAERAARQAEIGLWSPSTCAGQVIPAAATPLPTLPPTANTPARGLRCPREIDPTTATETPLRIVGLDKVAEVVEIVNVSLEPVNLEGWLLCSMRGNESQAGVAGIVAPGNTITLRNPASGIWSNNQRDDAALIDPAGRLVSYWVDQ